jgi:acetyl esterase
MPLDPRIADLLAGLSGGPRMEDMPIADFRAAIDGIPAWCAPAPKIAHTDDRTLAGVPVRVYHPQPGMPLPIIVYFHGGGWMTGSITSADPVCRRLAAWSGAVVINAGYRLAPEDPFPAALDDAWALTTWAAEHGASLGGDPTRIVVAGDSAGANLSTVVAAMARDAGGPPLLHQLLICPALDTAMDTPSYHEHATGYGCTADLMRIIWRTYLDRPDADFATAPWQAVPMRMPSVAGLPPATILTMEYDPLRDEGEAYGRRLTEAGVPTEIHRCLGMIHAAIHLDGITPHARDVYTVATEALRRAFTTTAASPAPVS